MNRIGTLAPADPVPQPARQHFTAQRPVLGIRCPQCKKRALRRAKRLDFFDRLALLALLRKMRCRYCRYTELRFVFDRN